MKKSSSVDWYMDMDAPANKVTLGISESQVKEHVLFIRKKGAAYPPGKIEYGFYILTADDAANFVWSLERSLVFFLEKVGTGIISFRRAFTS